MVRRTDAIVDEIVERISIGEPLRQICRDDHMPCWHTVYDWIRGDAELSTRFTRARELGADAIAEECLDIADNANNDWMEKNSDDNPGYQLNGEHIQRAKLRIETRLKLLAKWQPKKYGDKLSADINHSGEITTITRRIVKHGNDN